MMHAVLSRKSADATAVKTASKAQSTTLHIGEPNDAFEQEADHVADQVMAGGKSGLGWSVSRMGVTAPLRRKCSCGGSNGPAEEDKEDKIKEHLQRQAVDSAGPAIAPPIVHEVLASPGRPLDDRARSLFEPRFGYDFSKVRVHTDSKASESARAVNARAYTVGNDLVFARGHFDPATQAGRRVLAHELTHVVQQSAARTTAGGSSDRQIQAAPVKLARQAVNENAGGLPEPSNVELVEISCSSNDISFYTNQGLFRYGLTKCDLSDGEYDADVSTKGDNVDFDLGETAQEGVRFSFGYRILPGQTNPSRFFKHQSKVRIIARTTGRNLPVNPSIAKLPFSSYVDNFEDAVYDPDYNKQGTSLSTILRVRYADGTVIEINIYNLEDKAMSGQEVRDSIAQGYVGAGGRVFPLRMNAKTTPRLWAARQKALEEMDRLNIEFMKLALSAVMIVITIPAMPAGNPAEGAAGGIRASSRRVPRGSGNLPPTTTEELTPPPVATEERTPPPVNQEQLKAAGKTTPGTAGNKAASARALASEEGRAATPLTADQQVISKSLQNEHPGLNPEVANDASKGAASVAGKGGKGADVPLLNGGGREVSVHQESSPFTAASVGSHLQQEAMQQGTTEIYLQINSSGATREGFLKMLPSIRNAYLELRSVTVKIFGPDGKVWWSGVFGGPG